MDRTLAQTSLDLFAKDSLQSRLAQAAKEWDQCARSGDADSIHDLRVSLRRFGEALRIFKDLFPKPQRGQVRSELRQVMRLAGQTRDVDITRELFVYSDVSLTPELDLYLTNERAIAEAALRAALAVGVSTHFEKRWADTLALAQTAGARVARGAEPATASIWKPNELVSANASSVLPGLWLEYCEAGSKTAVDGVKPAKLHALRLIGKHLRYVLELFRPVYGAKADELLKHLKDTQTHLGEISDATATLRWIKERHLHHSPEAQHLRHYLDHRADRGAVRFIKYWNEHWTPAACEQWSIYLTRYAGRVAPTTRRTLAVATKPKRIEAAVSTAASPAL